MAGTNLLAANVSKSFLEAGKIAGKMSVLLTRADMDTSSVSVAEQQGAYRITSYKGGMAGAINQIQEHVKKNNKNKPLEKLIYRGHGLPAALSFNKNNGEDATILGVEVFAAELKNKKLLKKNGILELSSCLVAAQPQSLVKEIPGFSNADISKLYPKGFDSVAYLKEVSKNYGFVIVANQAVSYATDVSNPDNKVKTMSQALTIYPDGRVVKGTVK